MKNFIYKLLLVSIIFNITCTTDITLPTNTPKNVTYNYNQDELDVINGINNYRVSVGLNVLSKNDYISVKCEEHNNKMIINNSVDHSDFVYRSTDIMETLVATRVGENVAYNYSSPKKVVDAWLDSPLHKKNIVGDYTNFGVSIRLDSIGRKYYTNIFIKI